MWKFHTLHLPKPSAKPSAIPRYVGDLDTISGTASGQQRSIYLFGKRCALERDQKIQILTYTQVVMEQRVSQIAQSSYALHRKTGTWHMLYNVTRLTRTEQHLSSLKEKGYWNFKEKGIFLHSCGITLRLQLGSSLAWSGRFFWTPVMQTETQEMTSFSLE